MILLIFLMLAISEIILGRSVLQIEVKNCVYTEWNGIYIKKNNTPNILSTMYENVASKTKVIQFNPIQKLWVLLLIFNYLLLIIYICR